MSKDTALVVIDAQMGVVGEAYNHDEVLDNINLLLERARNSDTPVIYVQHNERGGMEPGMPLWQIHPAVTPHKGEPTIQKESPDSFHETRLQEELQVRGIKRLMITGGQTQLRRDLFPTDAHWLFTMGTGLFLTHFIDFFEAFQALREKLEPTARFRQGKRRRRTNILG